MARPRGAARSRRYAPPLDKPSRSGLLALRWFHDGLQTPTLVRLLVRTEKEEIMPRPHPHDIPKRNRIWKPEISKCDFFFFAKHGGCGIAARGTARAFGGGLRRSTVAHFARKVRGGGEYCGGQARAESPASSKPRATPWVT